MSESEGRFARTVGGYPYFARVTIRIAQEATPPCVSVECNGSGFGGSQGDFDDVSSEGYADWKAGAVEGAKYALQVAGKSDVSVAIVRIIGAITDTNPTIVGAATAYAVWAGLGFKPSEAIISRLEAITLRSWEAPFDAIPKYEN